jgi:hypothetical protein
MRPFPKKKYINLAGDTAWSWLEIYDLASFLGRNLNGWYLVCQRQKSKEFLSVPCGLRVERKFPRSLQSHGQWGLNN